MKMSTNVSVQMCMRMLRKEGTADITVVRAW